jgi:hypothetical protein
MMSIPVAPQNGPRTGPDHDRYGRQRFGHVAGRSTGEPGVYVVRDDETGLAYPFGYTDIVTEGLRTISTGERVRFLIDNGHATYVIRLDLPDIEAYYQ